MGSSSILTRSLVRFGLVCRAAWFFSPPGVPRKGARVEGDDLGMGPRLVGAGLASSSVTSLDTEAESSSEMGPGEGLSGRSPTMTQELWILYRITLQQHVVQESEKKKKKQRRCPDCYKEQGLRS
ncbi:unnamed protein product [Urochloa humidicola]